MQGVCQAGTNGTTRAEMKPETSEKVMLNAFQTRPSLDARLMALDDWASGCHGHFLAAKKKAVVKAVTFLIGPDERTTRLEIRATAGRAGFSEQWARVRQTRNAANKSQASTHYVDGSSPAPQVSGHAAGAPALPWRVASKTASGGVASNLYRSDASIVRTSLVAELSRLLAGPSGRVEQTAMDGQNMTASSGLEKIGSSSICQP
ncbi:hypothetical protein CLAIMM_12736 isoform 3 [Cladophialophora immunda]|nr:hypothetical protein CLAIMM_12736 isoform 1 [Cladophialophora immunda]OQV08468.1 hypothetical protein CLAIMM_12736 isoform 3 [Cladophialophora immunda]